LQGSGSTQVVANPNPVSFQSAIVGNTAFSSVTIANGGPAAATITGVSAITGANAADFSIPSFGNGCPNGTVLSAAGGSCFISLNFLSATAGTFTAQLSVSYSISGTPQTPIIVQMNATIPAAQATLSPNPLVFPSQTVNTQSQVLNVTVTNSVSATANLSVSAMQIVGSDFALAITPFPGGCQFSTLTPGQSCVIPITFTPAQASALNGRTGTLTITDNSSPTTQSITLQGTGVAGTVSASPTTLAFPLTTVGSSVTLGVILSNTTGSAVAFGGVTYSGPYSTDTTGANACSAAKPVGAVTGNCVVYIKFAPAGVTNNGTATIHYGASSSIVVTLSGAGSNPNVNATPNPITFGPQAVGTQSAQQGVTLSNPTGSAVTVSATPSISGANSGDFLLGTNSCTAGANLPASTGSCVTNVIFQPGAAGGTGRTASLNFSDSPDATSPHSVTLNGTAIQPVASLASGSIAFGSQNVGIVSGQQIVSLTNAGNAVLNISNVVLGGTNPGDFALVTPTSGSDCRTVGSLAASASCNVAATFDPSVTSARSATITITDNATPSTQVITLTGTGTQPGVLFAPTTVPFGNQHQGTTAAQMTSVLSNSGSGPLTITSVTVTGTNAGDFAVVAPASGTNCVTVGSVAAAGSCTIAVTFTPTAVGARTATVSVADNATGSPHTFVLTGTGTFPQASALPSPVGFGNQRQNTTSGVQAITLTNGGNETLNLTTVALGGTNANQFAIAAGTTCTNAGTVAAGASCVVNLTFTPTALGLQSATITFTDNASPTTQVVNISGTGVFPQANATPSPVAFGVQRQGTTSGTAQTVTLSNAGTGVLNLTTVGLGGTTAADFAIAGGTTCTNASTVAAGASCVVKLTFTPSGLGGRSATLTFTDDASPTTQVVNISGTGVFPQAGAAPATVGFGNQTNATTSAAHTITLSNGGTDTLHITTVALAGAGFAIVPGTTTCTNGGTVAAGASCVVNVTFTPTGLTAFSGTVTFTDDASPTTQVVNLTGTGVASTVNFNPSTVPFGNQHQGTTAAQMTSVLSNSGSGPLTITSVTVTGTDAGDFAVVAPASGTNCVTVGSVAAAGSCTIAVTFTPTAVGARTATVSVADNATGSPHTFVLTGTGTAPAVSLSSNIVSFTSQISSTTSSPQTLTLTNTGTDVLHLTTVALGGPTPADFAIATGTTCTNGSTVAAGSTCVVNLTFTPATASAFVATITFTDDATPSTQIVNIAGTGVTPPTATLSAGSLAFGNQRDHTASTAQNITIINSGGAPLNITSITIGGTNAADFALAAPGTTCPTSAGSVLPFNSCTLSVTFNPAVSGARNGNISIVVTGISNPAPITLTGTGIAPVGMLAPTSLTFSNQEVNTPSAAQPGTLTNSGTDILHITAVAISGTNASDFTIVAAGTSCETGLPTAVSVATSANCTWSVKFTPSAVGTRTASLTFTDDTAAVAGTTQSVPLTGTGTAPVVVLNPTTVTFPAQVLNTTSAAMNGMLTNTGNNVLHLTTVAITGTNVSDFALVGAGTTCTNGLSVAVTNGSCTWSITFTPTAIGTRTATLTFTDDNNGTVGATQAVALTGVTPPAANLSAATLAFNAQLMGSTSSSSPVTISNPGGSTLHFAATGAFAFSGANASDFAINSTGTTCTNGSTVAPAASCVINVTFTPAAAGARAGTLTITDDASPSTTQTVALTGSGVDFAITSSGSGALSITAGTPASVAITVATTPNNAPLPADVTFSCAVPAGLIGTQCALNPAKILAGTVNGSTSLSITTTAALPAAPQHRDPWTPSAPWSIATVTAAMLGILFAKRRTTAILGARPAYLTLALLAIATASIIGCTSANMSTPKGPSTVTVTATSSGVTKTTTVNINVQ
jgi:hypothetical protein